MSGSLSPESPNSCLQGKKGEGETSSNVGPGEEAGRGTDERGKEARGVVEAG